MATILTYDKHAEQLTQEAEPVAQGEKVRDLVDELFASMDYPNGIGIAAPQIGVNKQIICWQVPMFKRGTTQRTGVVKGYMINPEIIFKKGAMVLGYEGCLSFPGIQVCVPRWPRIRIRGVDVRHEPLTVGGKGLVARVMQHEIDHLHGRTLAHYEALRQSVLGSNPDFDNAQNEDNANGE